MIDIDEALVAAYAADDVEQFHYIGTCDGVEWKTVFRRLAKLPPPSPAMQRAFEQVWIEHKHMALAVGDHRLVVAVARKLLAPYRGPAVRLFRGTHTRERQARRYGLSWSADRGMAERFAGPNFKLRREHPQLGIDGVVLETLAPPEAIIHEMVYPEPFSDEERAKYPGARFIEFHDEREYLVDRRFLNLVETAR